MTDTLKEIKETLGLMESSQMPSVTHRLITTPTHIHLYLWVNGAQAGGLCVRTDEVLVVETIMDMLRSKANDEHSDDEEAD